VGEEFASKWQFLPFIERGLHQYCRVDLGNVGVGPRRLFLSAGSRHLSLKLSLHLFCCTIHRRRDPPAVGGGRASRRR
jgi:hypothetical protein